MKKTWRRRTGVIKRAGVLGAIPGDAFARSPTTIDGGDDAPLTQRGRIVFRGILFGLVLVGVALVAIVAASD